MGILKLYVSNILELESSEYIQGFFFKGYWRVVDLQCCDNFCCTGESKIIFFKNKLFLQNKADNSIYPLWYSLMYRFLYVSFNEAYLY